MKKIVMLSASWCAPCKMMKPIVRNLQEQMKELDIQIVDVDEAAGQNLIQEHQVTNVPTFVFYHDDYVEKVPGAIPPPQLKELFENYLTQVS